MTFAIDRKSGVPYYRQIIEQAKYAISRGELYCFLGPNGAGKTTTIKIFTGLLKPTRGRVVIGGYDLEKEPEEAKRLVGYVPERAFLYDKLTGREFLSFVGGVYGKEKKALEKRVGEMIATFGLEEVQDSLIQSYSHGMRQRLIFASAFLPSPEVVIIDEPMVGLDPRAGRHIKDFLREKTRQGMCVFISTHVLEVAEELADRIGIIRAGKMVAEGTLTDRKLYNPPQPNLRSPYALSPTGLPSDGIIRPRTRKRSGNGVERQARRESAGKRDRYPPPGRYCQAVNSRKLLEAPLGKPTPPGEAHR